MKINVICGRRRNTVALLSRGLVCGFEGGRVVEEGGALGGREGGGGSEERAKG
jgi:hypothetical protein